MTLQQPALIPQKKSQKKQHSAVIVVHVKCPPSHQQDASGCYHLAPLVEKKSAWLALKVTDRRLVRSPSKMFPLYKHFLWALFQIPLRFRTRSTSHKPKDVGSHRGEKNSVNKRTLVLCRRKCEINPMGLVCPSCLSGYFFTKDIFQSAPVLILLYLFLRRRKTTQSRRGWVVGVTVF